MVFFLFFFCLKVCFITGNRYWQFFSLVILVQNMSVRYLQPNNYCLSVLSVCFTKKWLILELEWSPFLLHSLHANLPKGLLCLKFFCWFYRWRTSGCGLLLFMMQPSMVTRQQILHSDARPFPVEGRALGGEGLGLRWILHRWAHPPVPSSAGQAVCSPSGLGQSSRGCK